jgi:hypothetical protein
MWQFKFFNGKIEYLSDHILDGIFYCKFVKISVGFTLFHYFYNALKKTLIMVRFVTYLFFITLLISCQQNKGKPSTLTDLKSVYRDAFKIGVALNDDIVTGKDSLSLSLVKTHFNSITAENVMKAETLSPEPGLYNFGPADAFVDFGLRLWFGTINVLIGFLKIKMEINCL